MNASSQIYNALTRIPEEMSVGELNQAVKDLREALYQKQIKLQALENVYNNPELLEVARKAVEDALIDMRDSHIFMLRNNGLVIKDKDGSNSSIIRLGPENAVAIGMKAITEYLQKNT